MKRLGWIVVLMLGAVSTFGQGFSGQPADKKFYFGGGGSFGSGTNSYSFRYTYYSLFPIVGYRITPQFSAGTGVTANQTFNVYRRLRFEAFVGLLPRQIVDPVLDAE